MHYPHILNTQPQTTQQDMETKLWAINPGLAVGLAGVGAFVAGMGVHVLTRGTTINTGVDKASFGN